MHYAGLAVAVRLLARLAVVVVVVVVVVAAAVVAVVVVAAAVAAREQLHGSHGGSLVGRADETEG